MFLVETERPEARKSERSGTSAFSALVEEENMTYGAIEELLITAYGQSILDAPITVNPSR